MEVELGFLENTSSVKLGSIYFPSKVGGFPSWLDLKNLPSTENLLCDVCEHPCVFLMQMYSPGDNARPETFHRTVLLFMCKNPACCVRNKNSGNFKVFRNQLSRKNDYYRFDPPSDDDSECDDSLSERSKLTNEPKVEHLSDKVMTKVCLVCGCGAPRHCANCKVAYYCCRLHQEMDWKAGHKKLCKSG